MRRLTKKIAASALALSLVFTMGTQCLLQTGGSYSEAQKDGMKELKEL